MVTLKTRLALLIRVSLEVLQLVQFDYDMHFVEANVKTLGLEVNDELRP
ncbi:hypothetical protein Q604_UNBC18125G0001, partial [human gut metagenome]